MTGSGDTPIVNRRPSTLWFLSAVLWAALVVTALVLGSRPAGASGIPSGIITTCNSPTETVVSVGTTATNCPAAQVAGRKYVVICNSIENSGTPKAKVRIDGTAPVIGITAIGTALGKGDCVTFHVSDGIVPQCIADTASTGVSIIQCK